MKRNTKTILLGLLLVTAIGFSVRGLNMIDDPSSSEPEAIPVYNIGERPNHPFYAIGEQVILTVTVLPEDASDKTVVWTSSDATKVSITKLTDFTARMRCEAEFTGSVMITATATNGTADPSDDFSVTCTVTYVVPVESMQLIWAGSPLINPATHVFEIGDFLFFDVEVLPANATDKTYTVDFDDTILEMSSTGWGELEFEIISYTSVGSPTGILVESTVWDVFDNISITVGQEYNSIEFFNSSKVFRSTNGGITFGEIGQSLGDYVDAYWEYGNVRFNIGDLIMLDFNGLPFKENTLQIQFNTAYYDFLEVDTSDTFFGIIFSSSVYQGWETVTFSPDQANYGIVFEVLAPVVDDEIDIIFPDYGAHLNVPFTLSRPVSGITIDTDTYVF